MEKVSAVWPWKVEAVPYFAFFPRLSETTRVYPPDVLLFEGILAFYNQEIRDMFHLKLFVDTDSDVRLSRRGEILLDYNISYTKASLTLH